MSPRRVWFTYLVVVAAIFAIFLAWASWLSDTCVACSAPVRLDRPGAVRVEARRLANEEYGPSFVVAGPVPVDFEWYDQADQHLWQGVPPEVEIEIEDGAGRVVLRERGTIQRDRDWIVSGTAGAGPVDVYKLTHFTGTPFRKYSVTVKVLRGSPAASAYHVEFRLSRICEYEGLERIAEFVLLALFVPVVAVLIAVALRCRETVGAIQRARVYLFRYTVSLQ
ncbi:MAG: hypothetical protein WAM82_24660 [Thermoanaerobaculia bacterium]